MQAPYPMLWFENDAEEAADLYTSLMPDSEVLEIERRGEGVPGGEAGDVLSVTFTIGGARFSALNGGPHHPFNDAISLVVECSGQAEIDRVWEALLAGGGEEVQCGWLKDRFGVSWQVIPDNLSELLTSQDAIQAMLAMQKLDIAALRAAGP